MKVRDIMKKDVTVIRHTASYKEVARMLHDENISGAPVVNEEGKLVGIISEKDLFKVLYPFYDSFYSAPEIYTDFEEREKKINEIQDRTIERFMTKALITVDPETPIMKIGAIMLAKSINRLPVVENEKLVGIVSRRDIFKKILQKQFGF